MGARGPQPRSALGVIGLDFDDKRRLKAEAVASNAHVPGHLGDAGAALYVKALDEFAFETETELSILERAAEALDRMREAQAAIAKYGVVYACGEGGLIKPNPACAVERDSRNAYLACMRQLRIGQDRDG